MNTQQKVVISQKNHYGTNLSANQNNPPEQSYQKQKNTYNVNNEFASTMDKFDSIKNQLLQLNGPQNHTQSQNSKSQKSQHLVSNLRQSINPQMESAKNVHFQKYENHQRDQYHGSISSNSGILEKVSIKPTFLNVKNSNSQPGLQQLQQQFQNQKNSLQNNCQSAKNLNQRLEDLAATIPQQSQINQAYPYRLIKENQADNYFEKVKKDSYANKINHQMDMKQYTLFMNQKSNSEQNLFQLNKDDIEQMDNNIQPLKLQTQKKVPSCSVFQQMLSKSNENTQKLTFLKQNQIGQTPQSLIKGIIKNGSKNVRKEEDEDATNNLYFQINVQNDNDPQPHIIYPQTERYTNNTPLSQNRGPSFISNDSSNKKQKYAEQLSNNQQYQTKKKLKINLKQSSKNTYANSEQMKSGINSVLEMNNKDIPNHESKKSQIYFKNEINEQVLPQKVRNSVDHKYSENQLLMNTQNVYNSCQKMNKDTGFESPFDQYDHSSQMAKAQNLNTQINCQPSNIIRTSTSQKRIPETKTLLNTHKINQQYLTQRKYSKDNSQKTEIHLKSTNQQRQSDIDAFGNNQKDNSSYQNEDTVNVKSLVKEVQKCKKNNQKIRELLQNTSISLSQLSKNSQFVKHQDNIIHQIWSQNENDKNSQTRMLSNAFQENQSRIQVQKLSFFSKNSQLDQVFQIISKDISLIDSDLNKIHYQMMNSEENLNQLETGLKNLLHTYPQSTLNQILLLQDSWKNLKKENKYFENQLNLKIAENEKLEKMKKELDDRLYLKQFQSEGLQKMLDECRSDNQLLIKKVDLLQQNLISKQKKKFDIGTTTQELFKLQSDQNNDRHLVLLCQTQKFLESMKNLQKSLNLSKKSQCEETQMHNRKQKQKFELCQMSLEDTIKENIQFLEKEFENSQNECNPVLQKNIHSDHLGKNKFLNQLDGEINKLQDQNNDLTSIIEEKDIFIHKLKFKEDNLLTQNKLLQNQTTILQQQISNLSKNLKAQNDEASRLCQIKKDKQTQTIVQKIKKVKKSQIQILESSHLSIMPDLEKLQKSFEEIQVLKMKLVKTEENMSQQTQEKQVLSQQLGRQEQSMEILKQQIQSMQDLQMEQEEQSQSQIMLKDSCQNCGLMEEQIQELQFQIQENMKQIDEVKGKKFYLKSQIDEILSFFQDKIDFQNFEDDSKIQKIKDYITDIEQTFKQNIIKIEQNFTLKESDLKNQLLQKEQQMNNIISQNQENHNQQISQLTSTKTEEINQKQALIDQLQFQINENKQKHLLEMNQMESQSQSQITEFQSLNQSIQLEKNQIQSLYNQQYNELLNKRNQIEDNFREHLRVHQDCQSIIHQLNENLKNEKVENENLQEMLVSKEEEIQKDKEDFRAIDAERADLENSLEKHVLSLSENRELISMLKEQVKKSVEKQKEQTQIISIQKEKILSLQSLDQEKFDLKSIDTQTYETVESMRLQNEDNLKKQAFLQQQISNLKIQFSDKFSDSEEQLRKIKFINEEQKHQILAQDNKIDEFQNYIQQFKSQIQNILQNYGIEIDQNHDNVIQLSLQHIEKILDQQNNEIVNLQQIKEFQNANQNKQLSEVYDKLTQAVQALLQSIDQNRIYKEKAQMKIKNYKRFIDKLKGNQKQELALIMQEQYQTQQSNNLQHEEQLQQKIQIIESRDQELKDLQLQNHSLINSRNMKLTELQQINDDLISEIQKGKEAKGNNISQFEQSDDSSSSNGSEIEQLELENMGLINKLQNSEREIQSLRDQIYALKHSNVEGQLTSQESQNLTLDNINKIKNLEHQFIELKNIIQTKHTEVLKESANNFIQSQFEDKIQQILQNCQKEEFQEESQQKIQIIKDQKDDLFLLYNDLIDIRIKIEDNIDLLDEKELVIMKDDLQYFQSENLELKLKVQALIIKNNHLQIKNDSNQKSNGNFHFKQISKDSGKNAVDISSIDLEIANNCDLLEQSQNMIVNNSLQSFKEFSNQNIVTKNESSIRSSQLKEQESLVSEIKSALSQSLQKIENSAEVSKISEQIDELINQALSLQDQHQCKQQLQSLAENVKQQILQLKGGNQVENKLDENNSFVSDSSKKSSSSQYQNLLQHIKATLIIYLKKNPIIDTQNESLLKIIQSMMKFTQEEINDLDQARKKLPVYVVDQSYQKKLQNLMSSKKSNNENLKKIQEQTISNKSEQKQNQIDEINNYYGNDGEDSKRPLSKAKNVFQGLFSKRSDSKQSESRSNNESQYSSHQKNLYAQTAQKQKDFVNSNNQEEENQKYGFNSSNK